MAESKDSEVKEKDAASSEEQAEKTAAPAKAETEKKAATDKKASAKKASLKKASPKKKEEKEESAAPKGYAVVRVGSHEMKVAEGDRVQLEWNQDFASAEELPKQIELDQVLLTKSAKGDTQIGTPLVEGAKVSANVIGQRIGAKVISYKKIRRHGYHKKQGHRQGYLEVEIASIP